jgi:hypothetical protein
MHPARLRSDGVLKPKLKSKNIICYAGLKSGRYFCVFKVLCFKNPLRRSRTKDMGTGAVRHAV